MNNYLERKMKVGENMQQGGYQLYELPQKLTLDAPLSVTGFPYVMDKPLRLRFTLSTPEGDAVADTIMTTTFYSNASVDLPVDSVAYTAIIAFGVPYSIFIVCTPNGEATISIIGG